jgi:hypothetical protein
MADLVCQGAAENEAQPAFINRSQAISSPAENACHQTLSAFDGYHRDGMTVGESQQLPYSNRLTWTRNRLSALDDQNAQAMMRHWPISRRR